MKINKISLKSGLLTLLIAVFLAVPFHSVLAEESTTASGITAVTSFQDVLRTHSYYVAVNYLSEQGVISGYPDETFKPDNSVNRAEVLKIILQGSELDVPEDFGASEFPDVDETAWFARFVMKAKQLGIVKGDDADGNFAPARQVNKAEFLKMLLVANQIKAETMQASENTADDVPIDAWFAPYVNYALNVGIVSKNSQGFVEPSKPLTRGEVADMMYLLILIKGSKDTQFLLHQAEAELAQIEVYIAANMVSNAKRASELAVDLTQQAYRNMPENNVVLGAAKLAKSYDWLVDAFILGVQKENEQSAEWANKAIDKATEAWEANNATQPIARHIKDRAREILAQVGGTETTE